MNRGSVGGAGEPSAAVSRVNASGDSILSFFLSFFLSDNSQRLGLFPANPDLFLE
jgi:hypothetical protein